MSVSVADWSELQPELLDSISKNLKHIKDYIRFRSVCSTWRKSTPQTPKHLPSQLPWLMLPHYPNTDSQSSHTARHSAFFSLADNKTHSLAFPEASPIRRRCGSCHGWLVFLEETPAIFVINPLTRARHCLPPLSAFPNVTSFDLYNVGREYTLRTTEGGVYTCGLKEMRDTFVKKVVFSCSPVCDECTVVVLLNQTGDLAYCKIGDGLWRFMDDVQTYSEDVVYHKGCFYAVSKYGSIAVCDVCGGLPSVSFVNTPVQAGGDMQYLVSLGDELLLVTRYLEVEVDVDHRHQFDVCYKTTEFRVHRLVLDGSVWEGVGRLDEWALFLGESSSMAFRAFEFEGCEGNKIYFTDDYSEWNYDGANGDHDLGVYDLEDGSVVSLPCYPRTFYSGRRWPPPIWITPSLH